MCTARPGRERLVGSLDFPLLRLGTEDPIALCPDHVDGDHEMPAGLFDGNRLTGQVENQYETPAIATEVVLIPNLTFVTEPLQGHDLGAWLVAETIPRMLPTGLVLLWPYPVRVTDPGPDSNSDSVQIAVLDGAIGRLSDHFRSCGLYTGRVRALGAGNVDRLDGAGGGTGPSRCGPGHHGGAHARAAPGRVHAAGAGPVSRTHLASGRSRRDRIGMQWSLPLPVDLGAMPEPDRDDHQFVLADLGDDAPVTDPVAPVPRVVRRQRFAPLTGVVQLADLVEVCPDPPQCCAVDTAGGLVELRRGSQVPPGHTPSSSHSSWAGRLC